MVSGLLPCYICDGSGVFEDAECPLCEGDKYLPAFVVIEYHTCHSCGGECKHGESKKGKAGIGASFCDVLSGFA
jgi:hypothetical protein